MEGELPSEFDLIVIGTGLTESIIAAAASRIGKNVLHADSNSYYGGLWASFTLDSISKISGSTPQSESDATKECLTFGNNNFSITNIKEEWHVSEGNIEKLNECTIEDDPQQIIENENWTKNKLLALSRKFNIDLLPKLHFARGEFVELLISSNIARYSEFRSVSRVLTWLNNKLEVVPCSRSDVFSSNNVTVVEKRMLMKLLNVCLDSTDQDFAEYENKTFHAFLKDQKLTANLIHYILYAIAMGTEKTSCRDGVERIKRFLNSLGRYGKTPFLYSMYGSGEIPQAFCRLSAVFGATYALSQSLQGVVMDDKNNYKGIMCGNQQINSSKIVIGLDKAPKAFVDHIKPLRLSRGIFITDRSLLESEKEHLSLLLFPPMNDKNPVTILEMGSLTGTCPKGLYLVHMMTDQSNNPYDDLKYYVDTLFTKSAENVNIEGGDVENRPQLLWSFYFSVPVSNDFNFQKDLPNIFVCSGPDSDLDYDPSIKIAKGIFEKMYPDSEFLPRAPDPEEIVIEGDESNENEEILQKDLDEKCKQQNKQNEITEAENNEA
ncbi:rab proteins geranylgeranyltransferase component A 2 [Agrilus planipennis]|uniref:Rab proteins geranylgeranyltransferase component A n=1 Tax=Agrilus planipennis TaxID=224129 RepID=A0A1W4XR02_AGRPL|nr:rab proteins geranylgeranyltransferase component A 2 [Agrilus planipennis]